jgi:succinylarginine dihydrolase
MRRSEPSTDGQATELQIDGLVGPTHNFSGLSFGNTASTASSGKTSRPRAAALEGLDKMALVAGLNAPQAFLPPHPRPDVAFLRRMVGAAGSLADLLERAYQLSPALLAAAWSSSPMWTANAATVFPSVDTIDGRVHLVTANLHTQLHRSIEPAHTQFLLSWLFGDRSKFEVHPALPGHTLLRDEGAANQMRVAGSHSGKGVHILVYGQSDDGGHNPVGFPARQSRRASQATALVGNAMADRVMYVQQSPVAIDAGAFHNDVVAVANESLLLAHEQAFVMSPSELAAQASKACGSEISCLVAEAEELPLAEAIRTYLFNSQLLSTAGGMTLVAPAECQSSPQVQAVIGRWLASGKQLSDVRYVSVRESMSNGGGPACLRLRVPLTPLELSTVNRELLLTPAKLSTLRTFVEKRYPESIRPEELRDSVLARHCLDLVSDLYSTLDPTGAHRCTVDLM